MVGSSQSKARFVTYEQSHLLIVCFLIAFTKVKTDPLPEPKTASLIGPALLKRIASFSSALTSPDGDCFFLRILAFATAAKVLSGTARIHADSHVEIAVHFITAGAFHTPEAE